MENASKALLMAAGVLIGILILSLMVTLFLSAKDVSSRHNQVKRTEEVEQFNTNFTKYVGKDITTHQVLTICNFALKQNNKIKEVRVIGVTGITTERIKEDLDNDELYYTMRITAVDDNGYVSEVTINKK